MKILIKILIVLGVLFTKSSCRPGNQHIYVRNGTNDTIYWVDMLSRDTINLPDWRIPSLYKLPPYSTKYIFDTFDFEELVYPASGYLIVFFIERKTVEKYGEDYIFENNIYDKRVAVDMNDLKKMNYIIVYP